MSRFFTGALIGLVVGLLIAPDKGENTRNNLVDQADRFRNKLDRLAGRKGTDLARLRALLDSNIEGLSEDVKSRIRTILDEAHEMGYSARTHIGSNVL